MQTKMLVKKPEQASGITNNPVNSNHMNKPAAKKKNVRTTEYVKLWQLMLNDPDSITNEEFLFLQSVIGYQQTVKIREEAKLRKKQRKLGQTNVAVKPILLQRSNSEIEKDSDGKEYTVSKDNGTKTPIQMKKDDGNTSSSSSSMQHNLRAGLEKLSGVDLSNIKVHQNSDKPQQVGALAYTQGNDIHIAPGQEKHLPHEGWHAVQQKQGRVEPTAQMKTGALVNDDGGLEKEADIMGSKAVQIGSQNTSPRLNESSTTTVEQRKGNVIQKKAEADETKKVVLYKDGQYTIVKTTEITDYTKNNWVATTPKGNIVVYKDGCYKICDNTGEAAAYFNRGWTTSKPVVENKGTGNSILSELERFLREPITSTWGISDDDIEKWYLSHSNVKGKNAKYNLNAGNIRKVTNAVRTAGVSPVLFYIYSVNEGSGGSVAGGFINHWRPKNVDTTDLPVSSAIQDAKYLVKQSKNTNDRPATGGGEPTDMPTAAASKLLKSLPAGSIGIVYIPSTSACTAEINDLNGITGDWTGLYGNPLQTLMNCVKKLGGKF